MKSIRHVELVGGRFDGMELTIDYPGTERTFVLDIPYSRSGAGNAVTALRSGFAPFAQATYRGDPATGKLEFVEATIPGVVV
jgi:hypothetical protein